MSNLIQATKGEGEVLILRFDFQSQLAAGESVLTAICGGVVMSGEDSGAEDFVMGDCFIFDTVVHQHVQDGTAGVVYLVTCAMRTSLNNVRMMQSKVAVLPSVTGLDPELP